MISKVFKLTIGGRRGGQAPDDVVCFKPTASGTGDGSSWQNAMAGTQANVQTAINNAGTSGKNRLLFWEGTYNFYLTCGVAVNLIGGYHTDTYDTPSDTEKIDMDHKTIFTFTSTSTQRQLSSTVSGVVAQKIAFTGNSLGVGGTSSYYLTLRQCHVFKKNITVSETDGQGVIYSNLYDCYIYGNSFTGGNNLIFGSHSNNCRIYGNHNNKRYVQIFATGTIENCKIYGNYLYGSDNCSMSFNVWRIRNCIIYNNSFSGYYWGTIIASGARTYNLSVINNDSPNYSYAGGKCFHYNLICYGTHVLDAWSVEYYNSITNNNISSSNNNVSNATIDMQFLFNTPTTFNGVDATKVGADYADAMGTPETCQDAYWQSLHNADFRLKENTTSSGGQSLTIGVIQTGATTDADGLPRGVLSGGTRGTATAVGAYVAPSEKE